MDEEAKNRLRERNRNKNNCHKCGGTVVLRDDINDGSHFPGVLYAICTSCGHEEVRKRKNASKGK